MKVIAISKHKKDINYVGVLPISDDKSNEDVIALVDTLNEQYKNEDCFYLIDEVSDDVYNAIKHYQSKSINSLILYMMLLKLFIIKQGLPMVN